jgi:hypothetical protein
MKKIKPKVHVAEPATAEEILKSLRKSYPEFYKRKKPYGNFKK